ncbi:DUF2505 domain-containing protein [Nocardia alni]|uniref:DUF2505 domain-containing protein n=1 Tax=Nocardia alni TaxID=2815723 RepID=UPI001C2338A3|nr:DUF2505 domain-containing protein [Nocardia alni]
MPRRLPYSARYPLHTTKEVYAALGDHAYWEARMAKMREYSPNEVIDLQAGDGGIAVTIEHVLPRHMLPDLAQSVMRKDMVITRTEAYGPYAPEVTGTMSASIPTGPTGALEGTLHLFPTETGSTLRTTTSAKVSVPFLGPRLEQMILVNFVDLLRAEAEFTLQWLDEHNPTA